MLLCVSGTGPNLALGSTNYERVWRMRVTACVCVCGYCMDCVHVWPQACRKQVSRTERVFIMTLRLPNQTMATSLPPLHFFLSLSLSVLSILAPSNRVWTSTVKQTAAHTVGERKRLQKKKKEALGSTEKERRAAPSRAGHCFEERGFGFVHIWNNDYKKHFSCARETTRLHLHGINCWISLQTHP